MTILVHQESFVPSRRCHPGDAADAGKGPVRVAGSTGDDGAIAVRFGSARSPTPIARNPGSAALAVEFSGWATQFGSGYSER
jgi:hypothetical protein